MTVEEYMLGQMLFLYLFGVHLCREPHCPVLSLSVLWLLAVNE